MNQLRAVIQGYQDHLFDLKCLTAYAGYWAGYFSNSKHPKSLDSILRELYKSHRQARVRMQSSAEVAKPEVDVDAFLRREAQFNERLKRR